MDNKILIVDDTKSWQLFHKELICQLYGSLFDITTASSAIEALNLIKSKRFNPYKLVITDLQMESNFAPLSAGEWLIANIKTMREYIATPIVIVSSMYNIEIIAKKYNVDCISKSMLVSNKLLMKYMLEKLMPFLVKASDNNLLN